MLHPERCDEDLRTVPLPTVAESLLRLAEETAYSLGIALYICDGKIVQHGSGIRVEPRAGAKPNESLHNLPGGAATS